MVSLSKHILILSGHSEDAETLVAQLELSGYWDRVSLCLQLGEAVGFVSNTMPCVVICYHLAPEKEAVAWVKDLRARSCPVVVCDDQWPPDICDVHLSTEYDLGAFLASVSTFAPLPDNTPLLDAPVTDVERKYRDLFDRASDMIILIDLETHVIIDVNQRATETYGYAYDEFVGMSLLQLVPREEHISIYHNTRQMATDNVIIEVTDRTHIRKDGTRMPVSISAGLIEIDGRKVFQDIVRDETGRRQFEELQALTEHTQYQNLLISVSEAVQAMREPKDIAHICEHFFKLLRTFGFDFQILSAHRLIDEKTHEFETHRIALNDATTVLNRKHDELYDIWKKDVAVYWPDVEMPDLDIRQDMLAQIRAGYELPLRCVLNLPFSRGVLSFLSITPHAFKAADIRILERIAEVFSAGFIRAEDLDALLQAERNFRQMAEQIEDALYSVDAESMEFDYLSPAFERITGYTIEDIVEMGGRVAFLIETNENRDMVDPQQTMGSLRRADAPPTGRSEIWIRCKDGTKKCLDDRWVSIYNADGVLVSTDGVLRDVTAQKQLEAQLIQAQKMEVVGQLTGGIAHDFNNLTTIILGNCKYLLNHLGEQNPLREDVEEIRLAGDRAVGLIRQLLAFSRKQILTLMDVNLIETVESMFTMVRRLIGADIEIVTHFAPDVGFVRADTVQLEQVILNLALNARDAMPHGGTLTFEIENVDLTNAYASSYLEVDPGPYVLFAVGDTGIGMDDETVKRVFEPFFTTKEHGRGTGLGLATVYGIVKQCEGHISVFSELGHGTTFKVYLPRVDLPQDIVLSRTEENTGYGTEVVLLVEDDVSVRNVIQRELMSLGYTVWAAHNGTEALGIIEEAVSLPHMMVTDLVMPDMGGRELVDRLVALDIHLPVIFMTGYMNGAMVDQAIVVSDAPFLQKPFDVSVLATKIRELLDPSL